MRHVRKLVGLTLFILLVFTFMLPTRAAMVFFDDFSGDLGQWTSVSGMWSVEDGECSQSDDTLMRVSIAGEEWGDYMVQARMKRVSGWAWVGLLFRVLDGNNFYLFGLRDGGQYYIGKYVDGAWVKIQPWTSIAVDIDVWNTLRIEAEGSNIRLWLNDNFVGSFSDDWRSSGKIGLASCYCQAHFDDVIVMNPIPDINAVPEPTPVIISVLLFAALASYWLVRKRTGNKAIVKPYN